jgi:hypothetical protein
MAMSEKNPIPETNSLDSFEGVAEESNVEQEVAHSELLDEEKGGEEQTAQKLEDVRAELAGEEIVNPLYESGLKRLEDLKTYYQFFDPQAPDLSRDIEKIKGHVRALDELNRELGRVRMDRLKDKLLELKGSIKFFIKDSEENKIGQKSWFGYGAMKNRAGVTSLSKKIAEDIATICEQYSTYMQQYLTAENLPPAKTVLPGLINLTESIMFERDAGAGALKGWTYRIPGYQNAILSFHANEGRSKNDPNIIVQATLWDKDGELNIDGEGIEVLDSHKQKIGNFEENHIVLDADKIKDGFYIQKGEKQYPLVFDFRD